MSMMEKIREGTETGWVRVVLGITLVVFVFWGINSGSNSNKGQVIAEVNGTRITDTEYHHRMRAQIHQENRAMTEEEQKALANDVINQLIVEEILRQEAQRLGLEVSAKEVAQVIFKSPAFKDEKGVFSAELYEKYLSRQGTKRDLFEEDLRQGLVIEKLQDLVRRSVDVREDEAMAWWLQSETRVEVEYVRVQALNFYDDVQPTQAEIDTFVSENGPDISTWYREHYEGRFHTPMRALVRTLTLKRGVADVDDPTLEERMASIYKMAQGGADFAELARTWGEDLSAVNGGSAGLVSRDMLDPDVAQAVFGPQDAPVSTVGLRAPVHSSSGLVLALVEEIQPEVTRKEEDVRGEIAVEMLREKKAPELARAYAQQILDAWKAGSAAPQAMLDAQGIRLLSTRPTSLASPEVPDLKDLPEVAKALPALQEGQVMDAVLTTPDAWYVVGVRSRTNPDPSAWEANRSKATWQIRMIRQAEFLRDWRDDLVARARVVQTITF